MEERHSGWAMIYDLLDGVIIGFICRRTVQGKY